MLLLLIGIKKKYCTDTFENNFELGICRGYDIHYTILYNVIVGLMIKLFMTENLKNVYSTCKFK